MVYRCKFCKGDMVTAREENRHALGMRDFCVMCFKPDALERVDAAEAGEVAKSWEAGFGCKSDDELKRLAGALAREA